MGWGAERNHPFQTHPSSGLKEGAALPQPPSLGLPRPPSALCSVDRTLFGFVEATWLSGMSPSLDQGLWG